MLELSVIFLGKHPELCNVQGNSVWPFKTTSLIIYALTPAIIIFRPLRPKLGVTVFPAATALEVLVGSTPRRQTTKF